MYKANVTKAKTHNKEDVKIKNKSRKEPAGFLSLSPLLVVRFKIENKQNNTKQIIQSKNKSLSSHLKFFNICHSSGVSQEPAGFSSFPLLVVVGDVDLGGGWCGWNRDCCYGLSRVRNADQPHFHHLSQIFLRIY